MFPPELPENKHPLNQRALELLGQLKVGAHPDEMYLIQLLRWGLNSLPLDLAVSEEEFPEILARHSPDLVMRKLNREEGYLDPWDLDGQDPEAAVQRLLEAVRYLGD